MNGQPFDLGEIGAVASDVYYLGPAPNTYSASSGQSTTRPPAASVPGYDADPQAVFALWFAGISLAYFNRQGGAWAQVTPPGGLVYASRADALAAGGGGGGSAVNGIYTLTRIDDTLCYASEELIVPVPTPGAQANFWPYA